MTRDHCLTAFGYTDCAVEVCAAIDSVYDDFESRTCENCIWFEDGFIEGSSLCGHDFLYTQGNAFKCFIGFGCNKWEAKC